MKKIDCLKSVAKVGITLFTVNQLCMPVFGPFIWSIYLPRIKANKSKIEEYKKLPKDFTALDYTNLSNMLINNYSNGNGDCKDYSKGTFKTYKELIKQNNREDLKNDIRLAGGMYGYSLKEQGHEWVELKHKGEWIRYESVWNTPELEIEQVKEYSKKSLKNKTNLAGDDSKIVEIAQTFNGTSIFYSKPASVVNLGIAELVYGAITKVIK